MTGKLLTAFVAVFALLAAVAAERPDLPNRTYDKLTYDPAGAEVSSAVRAMTPEERRTLAGRQRVLCMVGDSVTWAEDGDHFRGEFLKLIPDLAFAGTHSAVLGFAHAGEGGDSTIRVLNRIDDPERVPAAPYYHLLIGINDCSAARKDADMDGVAEGTVKRIAEIVDRLLRKPGARKVFLASILPSPFDREGNSTARERTGALVNAKLRKDFQKLFPDGRVVWIEYEKPLRADLAEWKRIENLRGAHPTRRGYRMAAALGAPVLRREMTAEREALPGTYGVEVVNLWSEEEMRSRPLLPGWYTLSMELDGCDEAAFTLASVCGKPALRFRKDWTLTGKPGTRVEVNFMTGYQNFGYTLAPFELELTRGKVKNIQIEKMRPLRHASRYGKGRFVDTVSPVALGEVLVRAQ